MRESRRQMDRDAHTLHVLFYLPDIHHAHTLRRLQSTRYHVHTLPLCKGAGGQQQEGDPLYLFCSIRVKFDGTLRLKPAFHQCAEDF